MRFRKKPVVIEAMRWDGNNTREIVQWAQGGWQHGGMWVKQLMLRGEARYALVIPTLEGEVSASVGDWIIKGVAGEFYPCKPEIFEATYSPVEEPTPPAAEAPGQEPVAANWKLMPAEPDQTMIDAADRARALPEHYIREIYAAMFAAVSAPPTYADAEAKEFERASWPNGSGNSVPAALRYLADHNRPQGGEQRFNSAHLYQLAAEIEDMAARPLFTAIRSLASPAPKGDEP